MCYKKLFRSRHKLDGRCTRLSRRLKPSWGTLDRILDRYFEIQEIFSCSSQSFVIFFSGSLRTTRTVDTSQLVKPRSKKITRARTYQKSEERSGSWRRPGYTDAWSQEGSLGRQDDIGCYMPLPPSPPKMLGSPPSLPPSPPRMLQLPPSLPLSDSQGKHFLNFLRSSYMPSSPWESAEGDGRYESTCNVTELNEAGVKFKVGSSSKGLLDVKFSNGVLEIPRIEITNFTVSSYCLGIVSPIP
ncbi:hypothetical protein HHK36_025759 [Tetracentron sinense]|uniref:Uncharacterized protein n=1 Tax=Tetracentron sinense TaxID=13715 RepID=A0A835D6Q2_TETSI|nr:hypothetical protein HHK36_025759 [Tetracentron sinense]